MFCFKIRESKANFFKYISFVDIMLVLPLFHLILQHFLQVNVRSLAVLHCWPINTQLGFSQILSNNFMYAQFVNINKQGVLENFPSTYLSHQQPVMGIYLDLNCQNSESLLNKSSTLRLFNGHHRWLIYDADANYTNFWQLFVNANLSIDADLTYAMNVNVKMPYENVENVTFRIYDVYNNGRHIGGKLNMTADREWSCNASSCQLKHYMTDLYKRSKYNNRNRMKDVTMRMATLVSKRPLNSPDSEMREFLSSINDPAVDGIQRFGFQLMSTLMEVLGCNASHQYRDRWSSGAVFGGAVGDIINETAELMSVPSIPMSERMKYVSLLIETGMFRLICMFRTPRNSVIQGDIVFLEPFSTAVWLIFAVVLFVAAILLWSTFTIEHRRMHLCISYVPSFLSACLITFGSACFQGSHLIPKSTGGRIAFLSLSLTSFIMYNYYTSMVVSSLLGSPVKSNIRTLDQLAESSLEVGLEPLSYTMAYLNSSRLAEVRKFVKYKIEAHNNSGNIWMPAEIGLLRVRNEPGFVYGFEATVGYAFVERFYKPHEICNLNEFMLRPESKLYTQLSQNSTYKEVIRLRTLRLLETGIYLKMRRFWLQSHLNCFANNFVIDVGMEYAAPLFFMLLIAYIFVLIVLMIEIACKRYENRFQPIILINN